MGKPFTPPLAAPAPGIAAAQRIALESEEEDAAPEAFSLTQADLNLLSPLLGRNVQSKAELLRAVGMLTGISVDGVGITLEPGLLARLKTRASANRAGFPEFVRKTVIEQLHSYVGW